MLSVWTLTIAAAVMIAVEVGGWNYDMDFIMKNPPPVLGLATLLLAFIQPFIALCRPDPEASSRWIFNWTHWFVGNAAHIVGMVNFCGQVSQLLSLDIGDVE